jgi:hypothetical protein
MAINLNNHSINKRSVEVVFEPLASRVFLRFSFYSFCFLELAYTPQRTIAQRFFNSLDDGRVFRVELSASRPLGPSRISCFELPHNAQPTIVQRVFSLNSPLPEEWRAATRCVFFYLL